MLAGIIIFICRGQGGVQDIFKPGVEFKSLLCQAGWFFPVEREW